MPTRLWIPSDLGTAKCLLWGTAVNTGSLSVSGSDIIQMNDLSGNARHLVSDSTKYPQYQATGLNGKATMSFATGRYLYSNSTLGSGLSTSLGAIFVGIMDTAVTANFGVAVGAASPANNSYSEPGGALLHEREGGTTINSYRNNAPFANSSVTSGTPFVRQSYFDGATNTVKWSLNGETINSAAYTAASFNSTIFPFLGYERASFTDIGAFWNSQISAVVYFTGVTDSEIQLLEGYIHWEYGLQANLPAGHPYKSAAPTITTGAATEVVSGLLATFFTQPLAVPFNIFLD